MIKSLSLKTEMLKLINKNIKQEYNSKEYLFNIPLFKNNNFSFYFKEGINIIYAPNGAGKTTLLNMLATTLACHQGGSSFFTNDWLSNIEKSVSYSHASYDINLREFGVDYESGHYSNAVYVNVEHDAQSALYCDPRKLRGLKHGGAEFDFDFFEDIKIDAKEKTSTGRKNKSRMNDILNLLKGEIDIKKEKIPYKEDYIRKSIERSAHLNQVLELITPSFEFGAKTILIDEPENALDIYSQREFFKLLKKNENRKDIQVIMITHSPLVFALDNINYITDDVKMLNSQMELVKSGLFFDLTK